MSLAKKLTLSAVAIAVLVAALSYSSLNAVRTLADHTRWAAFALIAFGFAVLAAVVLAWRRASRGLQQLAVELAQQAGQVAAAAESVSSASHSLAQGASDQAGSLEEVSASSADISSTAQKNAENARTSARVSTEVAGSLGDVNQRIEELMSAMGEIQASGAGIANIIKVIDGIAFQTNLLALNAAVEAPRVGEAGLGFAVVADEVRTLAQRSAQAARETAGLIEESAAASRHGQEKLAGVAAAFHDLVRGADTVTRLAGDVQAGSLDQAQRLASIGEKIGHMLRVTEPASAGAIESAQAGEELTGQAESMRQAVTRLVNVVGAG